MISGKFQNILLTFLKRMYVCTFSVTNSISPWLLTTKRNPSNACKICKYANLCKLDCKIQGICFVHIAEKASQVYQHMHFLQSHHCRLNNATSNKSGILDYPAAIANHTSSLCFTWVKWSQQYTASMQKKQAETDQYTQTETQSVWLWKLKFQKCIVIYTKFQKMRCCAQTWRISQRRILVAPG